MLPAKYQCNPLVALEKKSFEWFVTIYGHGGHLEF